MKVHLHHIPEGDTLHLEGSEDASPLELEEAGVMPVSPLEYSLDIGLSDGGLFATGRIAVRGRLTCVRCLEEYDQDFEVDPFSMQIELTGAELIDLTSVIREDIQLILPAHPRCDSSGGPKCPASRHDLLIASHESVHANASAWDALDKLKTKTK